MSNLQSSCGNCKYFQVWVNPETRRKQPKSAGYCTFPLPTKLPWFATLSVFYDGRVWPDNGARCETFEANVAEMRVTQLELK